MAKPTKSNKTPKKSKIQAKIYTAKSLGLTKHALPPAILEVVAQLSRAGFDAYIVGGGVRDSLLGLAPKDFDAVTNARPHEIKAIFGGRCRIIGKRFQLAHVYSGRELIEVATFRAPPKDDTHTTDEGMITRDNAWGTIEQDFARRDFSINALYYQPIKGEVLDFCGAIDDVLNKRLRLLGDAKVRIEEDPVRLLRALRFKAKLGFEFDENLAVQFHEHNWALLEQVSTHRLYDETQKMFSGGYIAPLLPLLYEYGAMTSLMTHPTSAPSRLVQEIAINTDKRVSEGKSVNPAFFYAGLLWDNYLYQLAKFKKRGLPFYEAQTKASAKVIDDQRQKTAIPRFAEEFISGVWLFQPKLVAPKEREIDSLMTHTRFRAGVDFLLLREQFDDSRLTEPTNGMGAWWQNYQTANPTQKSQMSEQFAKPTRTRRVRQRADSPEPTPVPVFAQVVYSEADFLRLLANDEPYIPAQRYRKRVSSSDLSIKEKQAMTDEASTSPKKTKTDKISKGKPQKPKPQKSKSAKADKTKADKPKKRKKSNAKPRAKHDD